MHSRTALRRALHDRMRAVPPVAGQDRAWTVAATIRDEAAVPSIEVSVLEETAAPGPSCRGLARRLTAVVIATVAVPPDRADDAADLADDVALAVEETVATDPTFGGLALAATLTASRIDLDTGARPMADVQLTFDVTMQPLTHAQMRAL